MDEPASESLDASFICPATGTETARTPMGCWSLAAPLKVASVPTGIFHPQPLHRQTAYKKFPVAGTLDCTERPCREVLSLPTHPYHEETEQDYIVGAVRGGMRDVPRIPVA